MDPTNLTLNVAGSALDLSWPADHTGWTLQARVDAVTGQIGITLFSATPIGTAIGGSLVTITFP